MDTKASDGVGLGRTTRYQEAGQSLRIYIYLLDINAPLEFQHPLVIREDTHESFTTAVDI